MKRRLLYYRSKTKAGNNLFVFSVFIFKVETEKINKLLPNIPTDNITKLNELIYAGAKLVCDKIGVPPKELEQKYKTWIEN